MRPKLFDFDLAVPDANGIADTSVSAAEGNIVIDGVDAGVSGGVWAASDGMAHLIILTDGTSHDQRGADYTLTGTDADGRALVEVIAGPNATATVTTTAPFKSLATVAVDGDAVAGSTIDLGTVATGDATSQTIPVDWYNENAPSVHTDITGTANWTLQLTNDDIFNCFKAAGQPGALEAPFRRDNQHDVKWFNDTNHASDTADELGAITPWPVRAIRLVFNTYSATAEMQMSLIHSSHRG